MMRHYLESIDAADSAVTGTVASLEDDVAFNAAYFLDTEQTPPVIAQFVEKGGLMVLARIALAPDGKPLGNITRQKSDPNMSAQLSSYMDLVDLPALHGGENAALTFETVYFNILAFEPNPTD